MVVRDSEIASTKRRFIVGGTPITDYNIVKRSSLNTALGDYLDIDKLSFVG